MNATELATQYRGEILAELDQPWAISPEARLHSFVSSIFEAGDTTPKKKTTLREAFPSSMDRYEGYGYEVINGVAVINVEGVIMKPFSLWGWFFGVVSTDMLAIDWQKAMSDPTVSGIMLNFNSPGGTVAGTKELADLVRSSRGQKKIVAYTGTQMTSAAYWIASAADQVIAGETAFTASIGVITVLAEYTEMLKKEGITVTVVRSAENKAVGGPYEKLTEDKLAIIKREVDDLAEIFVRNVALNRNMPVEKVKDTKASALIAKEALARHLIDRIGTREQALASAGNLSYIQLSSSEVETMPLSITKPDGSKCELNATTLKELASDVYDSVYKAGETAANTAAEQRAREAQTANEQAVATAKQSGRDEVRATAQAILDLVKENASADLKVKAVELFAQGKSADEAAREICKAALSAQAKPATPATTAAPAAAVEQFAAGAAPYAAAGNSSPAMTPEKIWESNESLRKAYEDRGGMQAFIDHSSAWKANASGEQKDFGGNMEAYLAYRRNEHKVRVSKRG